MELFTTTLTLDLDIGPDMGDITQALEDFLGESGIRDGVIHAFVMGTGGAITTIEFEPGVVENLKKTVTQMAPPDQPYAHELAWQDRNGHSHVQAALLGPSISLPVRKGKLTLSTWQKVVVINHDNNPQEREIEITLMGK